MPELLLTETGPTEATPDWEGVFDRVKVIGFPDDVHERASDVARNLAHAKDIEMVSKAIHDVLVPDVSSMPADYAVKVGDEALAQPHERPQMYDQAARLIKELDAMRSSSDDDTEFLRRAGNVIALTLVGAHTFENGNGRTARLVGELIRNGSQNKAEIMLLGTERDISQKQLNGFRIFSYVPSWRTKERGLTINDVIASAASVDIPFDQKQTYLDRNQDTFTAPDGP